MTRTMKTINLNYSKSMNLHTNNHYVAPWVEIIEVAVEKGYATTGGLGGSAPDSDDSEFSMPAQRHGTWGNLWE